MLRVGSWVLEEPDKVWAMSGGVKDSPAVAVAPVSFPVQPLEHLDALWIQVAGTHCNLSCSHCFVPSGPGIDRHRMMPRDEVRRHVADGLVQGVREVYLTGGEPFLHPELLEIVEDVLAHVPCTVLTNGTLFTTARLARLVELSDRSAFSLELRVSLDALTAAEHDAVRGPGAFERALGGLVALEHAGLMPIVTVTMPDGTGEADLAARCRALLKSRGLARPRLKLLPIFRIGRETVRSRAYDETESLGNVPTSLTRAAHLPCATCRAVTSRGVFVCPLLVDDDSARLGDSLGRAAGPFTLSTGPCFTCLTTGTTCSN
jgi:pyruvate-formate lyase-activating enzyme